MYQVNETFLSIDGEVNPWHQGVPSFFIRLQGCNLKCPYCDTKRTWVKEGGNLMTVEELCQIADTSGVRKITITGGEPLIQPLYPLVKRFVEQGYRVSVETNGVTRPDVKDFQLFATNPMTSLIIDIKLPSSQPSENIVWGFIRSMSSLKNTWLKFVVADYEDLRVAKDYITQMGLQSANLAFSPVVGEWGKLSYQDMVTWMVQQGFPLAVLNVQIHKLISMR